MECIGASFQFVLPHRSSRHEVVRTWKRPFWANKQRHWGIQAKFPGLCFFLIVLVTQGRVGEASHPGPPLILGAANPTGILDKEHLITTLPQGIWAFSETHLTDAGVNSFKHPFVISLEKMGHVSCQEHQPRICHIMLRV